MSDEEYRLAYEDRDNRNIIASILKQYEDKLSPDCLEDCGMNGLWRALQYHLPEFKQKFTTSLYRFLHWECRRELRKQYGRSKRRPLMFLPIYDRSVKEPVVRSNEQEELLAHVHECMGLLKEEWQRDIIRQYYFDGMTMQQIGETNGYSREAARHKVYEAMKSLREICLVDAGR